MIHRYFAMAVGVLIISLMVLAWVKRRELKQSPWFATGVFLLVCVQGAFGMLDRDDEAATDHRRHAPAAGDGAAGVADPARVAQRTAACRGAAGGFAALGRPAGPGAAGVQIFLGGWVSTNYAVLACTDFPLCNGQLVPRWTSAMASRCGASSA
jgi:cytochrome c oxidase assembly protein subunit 15